MKHHIRKSQVFTLLLVMLAGCWSWKIPSTKSPTTTGVGTEAPNAVLTFGISNSSYNFGSLTVGNSADKALTLSNSGNGAATSLSASFANSEFNFIGGTFPGTGGTCTTTLAASASCTLTLRWTPASSGSKSAVFSMSFTGGASTQEILTLLGTALSVAYLSISDGPTYDFGSVAVGASGAKVFTIANTGGSIASSLLDAAFSSSDFDFTGGTYPGTSGDCGSSLAASAGCSLDVTFTPQSSGAKSDTLSINYSNGAASSSTSRAMQGTATITTGASGALDTSFSTDGKLVIDDSQVFEDARGISFLPNKKIALIRHFVQFDR